MSFKKKNKKNKGGPRKKWSKTKGDFTVKHPIYDGGDVYIDVYYKDELIGIVESYSTLRYLDQTDEYELVINSIQKEDAVEIFRSRVIGFMKCRGLSHRLPKVIDNIYLSADCELILTKCLLIEKYFENNQTRFVVGLSPIRRRRRVAAKGPDR